MTLLELLSYTPSGKAIIRITQFCILWVLVWLPFGIPVALRFRWYPFKALPPQQKLILLLPLYAIAVPILLLIVPHPKALLQSYGLVLHPHFWSAGLIGLGLGLFSFGLLLGFERWQGWITFHPMATGSTDCQASQPSQNHLFPPATLTHTAISLGLLLLSLTVSWVEEFLFRGGLWSELRPVLTLNGAAIVSSIIFAVLHLIWEGWAARSQILGLTLMGLVLCLARWVDRDQLGLAWGLHAGWIWAIASLDAFQLLHPTPTAPLSWIGQPGQPLTGRLTLICLVLTGLSLTVASGVLN